MSNFIIVVVPCVLVRLGACCNDKTQWQNPLGKEMVYFILQFIVCHAGTVVRKLDLETVAKVMDVCNYRFASHGFSTCFLTQMKTICQRSAPRRLGHPYQSLIRTVSQSSLQAFCLSR